MHTEAEAGDIAAVAVDTPAVAAVVPVLALPAPVEAAAVQTAAPVGTEAPAVLLPAGSRVAVATLQVMFLQAVVLLVPQEAAGARCLKLVFRIDCRSLHFLHYCRIENNTSRYPFHKHDIDCRYLSR